MFSSDQNLNLPSIILRTNSPQFAAVLAELENQEHDDKQKHKQLINTKPVIKITQAAEKDSGFAKHDTDINDDSTKDCFSENASKSDDVLYHEEENKSEGNIDNESEERVHNYVVDMFRQQSNHSNNTTSRNDHQHRLITDRAKKSAKDEHTSSKGVSYFQKRGSSPAYLEKFTSLSLAQNHTIDKTQNQDVQPRMTKMKVKKHKINLTLNVNSEKTDESKSSDLRTVKSEVWLSPKLQRKSKTSSNLNNLPSLGASPTKIVSSVAKSASPTRHFGSTVQDAKTTSTKPTTPLSPRIPRRLLPTSHDSSFDKQGVSSEHESQALSNAFGSMDKHQSPPQGNEDETSESESPSSPSKPGSPRSPNSSNVFSPTKIPKPPGSPRPAHLNPRPSVVARPKSPCSPDKAKHIDTLQVDSPVTSPRFHRRSQSTPSVSPILQRRRSASCELKPEVEQKFHAFSRSIAQSPRRKSQAFEELKHLASTIIDQVEENNDNEDLPEVSMSDVLKAWHVTENNDLKVLNYIGVRDKTYSASSFTVDQAMELKDCRYLRRRSNEDVNNNNE